MHPEFLLIVALLSQKLQQLTPSVIYNVPGISLAILALLLHGLYRHLLERKS